MRALLLLLLIAGCATTEDTFTTSFDYADINPPSVFDVTTVYRLLGENALRREIDMSRLPDCYVNGDACTWTKNGWNASDSNYASIQYPLEVVHEGTTSFNKKPEIIRITTKKTAISIKPTSVHDTLYIFIMAEEDVDQSDMLVIILKNTREYQRESSESYRCLQTLAGNNPLPTMTDRKCTLLTSFSTQFGGWDTTRFNSFSVEIDEGELRVVHTNDQQEWFEMNLYTDFKELAEATNFIGFNINGDFKHSIPVDVLSLARKRGSLITQPIVKDSRIIYSTNNVETFICLQMYVYIHPESGGKVGMSLKFNNGTNINVGEIITTNNKVELWKFMSVFENGAYDDNNYKVHIDASKNSTYPVIVSGITTCNETGEFGNVVYNQPANGEVHMRTNSRGLPLLLPDGTVKSFKDGMQLEECSESSTGCAWTQNNFTRADNGDPIPPFNIDGDIDFVDIFSGNNPRTKPRRYANQLKFQYDATSSDSYGAFYLYLMDDQQDVEESDMYVMMLKWSNSGTSHLYRCTINESRAISLPGGLRRDCSIKGSFNFQTYFKDGNKYTFKLENEYGRIVLTVGYSGAEFVFFDWIDPSPIHTTHFALGHERLAGTLQGTSRGFPVLSLSELTGSLVSPVLPPSLDRVCLSLTSYSEPDASIDLLLRQDNVDTLIGKFQLRDTYSWTHRHIITQIPRKSQDEARIVLLATKGDNAKLLIQRVAGCNAEAPEDLFVLEKNSSITSIDVAHNYNYSAMVPSITQSNVCSNGVVLKGTGRCVCRPGFTGNDCTEGCGPNSYGSDCGGVCSEGVHGCRGLALCKPLLGCDCAPGYKGPLCNTLCERGEYGVGCGERCGHCAAESCDTYTGVCHQGCKPNYYPPFCHDVYSYIDNRPTVVVKGFDSANVMVNLHRYAGHGKPQFYQLQHKEQSESTWKLGTPQLYQEKGAEDKTDFVGRLTGLEPGSTYSVRVVLIDTSLASYQGNLVLNATFTTPCIEPGDDDYRYYEKRNDTNDLRVIDVAEDAFEVEWKVSHGNATWCKLIGYEIHVKAYWWWKVHSVSNDVTRKRVAGLSPGREYTVKVQGVTKRGVASFTHALSVTTADRAPDHVRNLRLSKAAERSIKVTWEEPRQTAGKIRRYVVKYQCLHLGACPEADCADSVGQMEVMSTSAQLDGLIPYALYKISVAGISGSVGLSSSIQAVTTLAAPDVAPSSVDAAVVNRTNSSFTVQWAAPENCRSLNGYLTGYRYELYPRGQKAPLDVNTTTNTSVSFSGLEPHTDFEVRVFTTNSAGWGTAHALEILTKTRATTPEVVENLTVYKRGRRMLGLRWSPPRMTYGALKSFKVTHRPLDATHKAVSATVHPNPCPAWPHLFCYSISNLRADVDYHVSVQARNTEVSEDGDEVTIKATTKEGAPTAPSFLRVTNKTEESFTIEWGLPDLVNGQLRSFLVNVEETDSLNTSDCCQYFPIREVIVTAESLSYEYQMTGLKAASSYEVGVTAKTVSLGPAVSLTAHTRPRPPVLAHAPKLAEPAQVGKPLKVLVEPSVEYQGDIVRGYMLLLKTEATEGSSLILDKWLARQLNEAMNGSFSLVAEYNGMNLPEDGVVLVDPGRANVAGVFGTVGITALLPNTQYRPVWVLVLQYCGSLSMGHILGEPFTVAEV